MPVPCGNQKTDVATCSVSQVRVISYAAVLQEEGVATNRATEWTARGNERGPHLRVQRLRLCGVAAATRGGRTQLHGHHILHFILHLILYVLHLWPAKGMVQIQAPRLSVDTC
jgi:hypothetical protein